MSTKLRKDFLWGYATASYQIEGSVDTRGKSVWDTHTHTPGKVVDHTTGDVATDSVRLWKEDIALLKSYGATTYRFSLSWPRIVPTGGKGEPVNEPGIKFYSDFIDGLLAAGITPFVTLFHWDTPQALQDRYLGWLDRQIIEDFEYFANICFRAFGDRVKHWLTMNEPYCVAQHGHFSGFHAPSRSSDRSKCAEGDSFTEPYIVAHNEILAHARVVKLYREQYKANQGGQIGLSFNGHTALPWDHSEENAKAAQDCYDRDFGWFADPIYKGHYPASMRKYLGSRLPEFTADEIAVVKGSTDFFGLNNYTTDLIKRGGTADTNFTERTFTRPDGTDLGVQAQVPWSQSYAPGFRILLNYLYKTYKHPIYITENGFSVKGENDFPLAQALEDTERVNYFKAYLAALLEAVNEDGVDVRSYIAWTLMDNFEWSDGYTSRFGVTYVNFDTLERIPKASSKFLTEFFKEHIAS